MAKEGRKVKGCTINQVQGSLMKYAFLICLFLAPLLTGLFPEPQFFAVSFLLVIIFIIYLWKNKDDIAFDIIDFIFLALACLYAFSTIGAASPRGSMLSFIRYLIYFLCFYFIRNSFSTENDKKRLILCFISSISAITILTVLTKAKALNFSSFIIEGRFAGAVEYSNTYAVLLVSVLVLLFYWEDYTYKPDNKPLSWISILAYLNAVALFATLSRGGVLIYVFMLAVLFFSTKDKRRLLTEIIIINALAVVSSAIIVKSSGPTVLAVVLGGGLLSVGLRQTILKLPGKIINISAGLIGFLFAVLLVINFDQTPLNRLLELNFASQGIYYRYIFYKDALNIFFDNWLFGAGGGGWELLYGKYQSFYYTSKLVHSSLIQALVEAGIVGALLFLAPMVLVIIQYIRRSEKTALNWAFLLFFLTIFLHSQIDFDLSIPAAAILMYSAMAVIAGPSASLIRGKGLKIALGISCVFVLVLVSSMGAASLSANDAMQDKTSTDLSAFKKSMSAAAKLDPLNKDYQIYLGQAFLSEADSGSNQDLIEQSINCYNRAIELEPENYLTHLAKGIALQKIDCFAEAALEYDQVIRLRPFHRMGYEYTMKNLYNHAVKTGDKEPLASILHVYDKTVQQMAKVSVANLQYVAENHRLNHLPTVNLYTGIAYSLLGDFEKGYEHLEAAVLADAGETLEESKPWLTAVSIRLNREVTVQVEEAGMEKIQKIIERFTNDYLP